MKKITANAGIVVLAIGLFQGSVTGQCRNQGIKVEHGGFFGACWEKKSIPMQKPCDKKIEDNSGSGERVVDICANGHSVFTNSSAFDSTWFAIGSGVTYNEVCNGSEVKEWHYCGSKRPEYEGNLFMEVQGVVYIHDAKAKASVQGSLEYQSEEEMAGVSLKNSSASTESSDAGTIMIGWKLLSGAYTFQTNTGENTEYVDRDTKPVREYKCGTPRFSYQTDNRIYVLVHANDTTPLGGATYATAFGSGHISGTIHLTEISECP